MTRKSSIYIGCFATKLAICGGGKIGESKVSSWFSLVWPSLFFIECIGAIFEREGKERCYNFMREKKAKSVWREK